jgi:hypothetical protein
MGELYDVHWTKTSFTKEIRPVFLGILVVDAVFEIIGQKVLQFNGRR